MQVNLDSELVEEIWDSVKDSIPPAKREDAALRYLKVCESGGVDLEDLEVEDPHLEEALRLLIDEQEDDLSEDELDF